MQTIVTDVCSICLSRGSTRLHCAKTAEQIKMLFEVNTLEGPRKLDGGPNAPQRGGGGIDAAFAKLLWSLVVFQVNLLICFFVFYLSLVSMSPVQHSRLPFI